MFSNTRNLTGAEELRIRAYHLVVLVLALFVATIAAGAQADSALSREYKLKAAFLYNFIKFVDWPKEKTGDSDEPIIIGIICKHPHWEAFEAIKVKKVKGKNIVIKWFKGFKEPGENGEKDKSELRRKIEVLRKCHLLFICSEEKNFKEIINSVKDHSVLTVGETKDFLESGGIINFLMEEKKVRFEINITAAKKAKLKIRSHLLKLAKRVVKEKPSERAKS